MEFLFRPSFFSFSLVFAVAIELLLGLLAVEKLLRKHHRDRWEIFTMERPRAVTGNFAPSFSLKFLSIFMNISRLIDPITLILVLLERSFLPAGLALSDANFG